MKLKSQEIKSDIYMLFRQTRRDLILFLTDKASVFFSLLAPLIILLLYILFLGDIQVDSVLNSIPQGFAINDKAVHSYVDSWMLAGVLSVACITVSLSANSVMVQDRSNGILNDCLSAPIKRWVLRFSYFLYNYIVTVIIVLVVMVVCFIYLASSGGWYLSAGDVFGIIGNIFLSALSSTLITVFICGFVRTEAQHGGLVGILSAVIGFIIGAYMPMSIMPKAAQYISAVVPGSHSSGIFKNLLMRGSLQNLAEGLPSEVVSGISDAFEMKVNFFEIDFGIGEMSLYLCASIVLFFVLNVLLSKRKQN